MNLLPGARNVCEKHESVHYNREVFKQRESHFSVLQMLIDCVDQKWRGESVANLVATIISFCNIKQNYEAPEWL